MVILIGTIGSTLGVICFTTYIGEKKKNIEMLTMFAKSYESKGMPKESVTEELPEPKPIPDMPKADTPQPIDEGKQEDIPFMEPGEEEEHRYKVSTFYAVAFQADGISRII